MRVADYIADYLYQQGVHHIFMVSGGGLMFLSDGLAKHPHIKAVCNHHEQASAMAAVAYAKYNRVLGAAYLTTGCGGTNAITGLLGAWQDNTPVFFISGQSKRKETVRNSGLKLRQFGVQEADIISIVEPLTKYAVMVNDPQEIAWHLDKALCLAKTGRPGPVWLDIPMDVQSAQVDPTSLKRFSETSASEKQPGPSLGDDDLAQVLAAFQQSRRPIMVAGQGIRLAGAIPQFQAFVERHQIPFATSRLGMDLLPSDHPLYIGRMGTKGDRPGNFAIQNADFILVVGSRLSVSSTGHEYHTFGREAKIIVVDVDPVEHQKKTVRIDRFIHAHAAPFLGRLLAATPALPDHRVWVETCQRWKAKWPVCSSQYSQPGPVNLYYFVEMLSRQLRPDDVVVSDAGSAFYVCAQGLKVRQAQRFITSGGQAEMGYTLPATVGVSLARQGGEVIGVTGDGSFQMNLQELQTIIHYNLPIKLFVWNNDGYLSIRSSQSRFFEGRFIGTDKTSGVSFPELRRIADAYRMSYFNIESTEQVEDGIRQVLAHPKAVLCEVNCLRDQEIIPTASTARRPDGTLVSKPLEDMYPFLDREEFLREMIVKPINFD